MDLFAYVGSTKLVDFHQRFSSHYLRKWARCCGQATENIKHRILPILACTEYTYIHTCIRTYIHTYKHTYVHTYMHTYIRTLHVISDPVNRKKLGRTDRKRAHHKQQAQEQQQQ